MSQGGEAAANDVKRAGTAAGFSMDVLKRAKRKAGVRSRKVGLTGGWVWAITELTDPPEPEGSTEGSEGGGTQYPTPFAPFVLPSAPVPAAEEDPYVTGGDRPAGTGAAGSPAGSIPVCADCDEPMLPWDLEPDEQYHPTCGPAWAALIQTCGAGGATA